MDTLEAQIAAYEARREQLERRHLGEWVVFHDDTLAGSYESFEDAANDAVRRFGRGPYLIREVGGDRPIPLPASLLYQPAHAHA